MVDGHFAEQFDLLSCETEVELRLGGHCNVHLILQMRNLLPSLRCVNLNPVARAILLASGERS